MSARAAQAGPVDEAARQAAIVERARNVVIDAGAGTGKTTLVVARVIERVAPSDGSPGIPIERLAAVTFTRRAAGELRLRIREGFLRAIADPATSDGRRALLRTALGGLDAAWIGTIHSFADRLLRLEPMASGLSPAYEIVEDGAPLHLETYRELIEASEAHRLFDVLGGRVDAARAAEVEQVFLDAIEVGLLAETKHHEWGDEWGLDALVSGFITRRDTPPVDAPVPRVDWKAFRKEARSFVGRAEAAGSTSRGQRFLQRAARELTRLLDETAPVLALRDLLELLHATPGDVKKKTDFVDDAEGWALWRDWSQGTEEDGTIPGRLLAPFVRWLSCRLVRAFPAVVAMFERVKARHEVLDQVDLLLVLRDVLQRDLGVRARLQGLFDHLFVDEFQDTDPLQAELLLFLCEDGAQAARWDEVKLAAGKLTIVGDPKQSIYRFRRADVLMYDSVRRKVAESPHLSIELTANFRSVSPLIAWFNHRFEEILEAPPRPGVRFDPDTGRVFHAPLAAGLGLSSSPPVWPIPFVPEVDKVAEVRAMEAEAWARGLRWLVEEEKPKVRDALTGRWRELRWGDVAVLAHVTTNVHLLLDAFDRHGVPWSARGGRLFLEDPLNQQFLLGLRALADRDDGLAQMALCRPPFFAVRLADLALAKEEDCPDEVKARVAPMKEFVRELRRRRFDRLPGETARDLLERSALGRTVALGPNGAQRLERLRELCFVLDRLATTQGLDFDAATAELRSWVDEAPPQLDAPHPVASEVVQVLSIHQAKGLEFPAVALWDARARWAPQRDGAAWSVSRDGTQWAVSLKDCRWSEPLTSDFAEREQRYAAAERQRLVYVAATRARDLLLLPQAGEDGSPDTYISDRLLAGAPARSVTRLTPWVEGSGTWPSWATPTKEFEFPHLPPVGAWAEADAKAWEAAVAAARQPVLAPLAVSKEAIRRVEAMRADEEDEVAEPPDKEREGRFGRAFGSTVHRALALALARPGLALADAVSQAAREWGLTEHLREAEADVARTLKTLEERGLARGAAGDFAVEYPVAVPERGQLLGGFIDLLVAKGGLLVVDFKTDARPRGDVLAALPEYVEQVRSYARILEAGGLAAPGTVRAALLFTETGELVQVPREER